MTAAVDRSDASARLDVRPAQLHLVAPHLASEVAAPASDALTPEARDSLLAANPRSFLHVYEEGAPAGAPHAAGAARLRALIDQGAFRSLPAPAFALYELRDRGHRQLGLVADIDVRAYGTGRVRPHETTRDDKVLELAHTLRSLRMSSSPVSLAYRDQPAVSELTRRVTTAEPELCFTAPDGVEQVVWVVADPELVDAFRRAFAAVGPLYIVDGHHRCAAASQRAADGATAHTDRGGKDATFLAVLFPDTQLRLASYHRCVARAPRADGLLAALARDFEVSRVPAGAAERARPSHPAEASMLLDGVWYRVRPRSDALSPPPAVLDAAVLQDRVLGPLLGVDPHNGDGLEHVPGTVGLDELQARCALTAEIAFVLHPVSLDQLRAVADRGAVLPPKSTYAHPKVGSGVFLRLD